jgi:two-component system cell cycle sensor histidine kinase/response regulator CckA
LLSLHFGLKGALLGLMMGTGLFVAVQTVLAVNFSPDDWRVTMPIYIAYGTLAISVGWLSEELHKYYDRALNNERMAAVGQMAVTVQHEINNALTSIVAESQFLLAPQAALDPTQQASARNIQDSARRIVSTVKRMANLANAPATSYVGGVKMIDLGAAKTKIAST